MKILQTLRSRDGAGDSMHKALGLIPAPPPKATKHSSSHGYRFMLSPPHLKNKEKLVAQWP